MFVNRKSHFFLDVSSTSQVQWILLLSTLRRTIPETQSWMCPGTLWFPSLWAEKPCMAWSAPAFLWAFCPAVQSVRNGDIYNHYKATVLAGFHSGAHVQVVTIWQDICSATGRALDAATCPQRRHCTLPFGGRRILCISTRWTVRVTQGEWVGFPLWLWSFMAFRFRTLTICFRMYVMRT